MHGAGNTRTGLSGIGWGRRNENGTAAGARGATATPRIGRIGKGKAHAHRECQHGGETQHTWANRAKPLKAARARGRQCYAQRVSAELMTVS